MKRVWAALIGIGMAIAAVVTTASAQDVIQFGAALSLTGKLAKEGQIYKQGYEFWAETVNAKGGVKVGDKSYKVQIIYYDDESEAKTGARLVERLITSDNVKFILGPYSSGITLAASAISEKYGALMVQGGGNADSLFSRGYKYLFGVLGPASTEMKDVVEVLAAHPSKPKTMAIVAENSLFPLLIAEGTKKWAEQSGFKVVLFDQYPRGTTDISGTITKLKSGGVDVFIGAGYISDAIMVLKQSRELGFNPKSFAFPVAVSIPDFRTTLGKDANYVSGPVYWIPEARFKDPVFGTSASYVERFQKKYNHVPEWHAVAASASCVVYVAAIEAAKSLEPEKVRQALLGLDMETVLGRVKFDQSGVNVGSRRVVVQIQNGEVVPIFPEEVAKAKLLFPTPPWTTR